MANCGPSSAVPSFEATPTVAFGSGGSRGFDRALGYGYGSGFGYGSGLRSGYGYGLGGNIESAANLGVLAGVIPSCINQLPPIEVVIKPAPVSLTVPGAIISATPEPVAVGGYAPCAVSGVGLGGFGGFGSGYNGGLYGGRVSGLLGSSAGFLGRGSICGPCA
ncbi:beta-keratin-related protein-like [Anolis carolinensis]|uniref:beta-keratin-related protein-like n=1 Tax=Anolis carolinensis TaxID=28377 RepID=UPI002F2B2C5D